MTSDNRSRQIEYYILTIALTSLLLSMGLGLSFSVINDFFSPDEADVANFSSHAGSFSDFSRSYGGGGPVGKVLFYLSYCIPGSGIKLNQAIACGITLANALYFVFLTRQYFFPHTSMLLVPVFLFTTSSPLIAFGSWGFFLYSLMLLSSTILTHILIVIIHSHCSSIRRTLSYLCIFILLEFTVIHCMLPIAVILFLFLVKLISNPDPEFNTSFLEHIPQDPYAIPTNPGRAYANRVHTFFRLALPSIYLGVPVLFVGIIILLFFSSSELHSPRRSLWEYYFLRSECSRDFPGVVSFASTRCLWFLRSAFQTYDGSFIQSLRMESNRPPFTLLSGCLSVCFAMGLVICGRSQNSLTRHLGAFIILSMSSLLFLSIFNIYPFGNIRYALFMMSPILIVTAIGLQCVLSIIWTFMRGLLDPHVKATTLSFAKHVLVSVLMVVGMLISINGTRTAINNATIYNHSFRQVVEAIDTDTSPAFVGDYYSKNLLSYRFPEKDFPEEFIFPRSFMIRDPNTETTLSEWKDFLNSHDTILSLMFNDLSGFPEYYDLVLRYFRVKSLPEVRWWNLERWERLEPLENRLTLANDLGSWEAEGDVAVTRSSGDSSELQSITQKLSIGANANLYHYIPWTLDPGVSVEASATLWADVKGSVGLSVERHGTTEPEGTREWFDIGPEPVVAKVTYTFVNSHKMLRIRLWAPADEGVSFYIKDVKLVAYAQW